MPLTKEYSQKVHDAFSLVQSKNGMTNANVKKLQRLLQYYPENKRLDVDGFYGGKTIKAIKSFYSKHYWTEDRKQKALIDKFGEKYIMQSELDQMKEYKKTGKVEY